MGILDNPSMYRKYVKNAGLSINNNTGVNSYILSRKIERILKRVWYANEMSSHTYFKLSRRIDSYSNSKLLQAYDCFLEDEKEAILKLIENKFNGDV